MEIFFEDHIQECYPEEIFESSKLSKNFLCPIKFGVFRSPVIDKCGHTYCETCIKHWLDSNKKETCPLTGLLTNRDVFVPNLTLRNMIDELSVKCLHSKKGCDWSGILAEFDTHIMQNCPEVRIKCIHLLCKRYVHRRKFDAHIENCEFRPTKCEMCSNLFCFNEIEVTKIKVSSFNIVRYLVSYDEMHLCNTAL